MSSVMTVLPFESVYLLNSAHTSVAQKNDVRTKTRKTDIDLSLLSPLPYFCKLKAASPTSFQKVP